MIENILLGRTPTLAVDPDLALYYRSIYDDQRIAMYSMRVVRGEDSLALALLQCFDVHFAYRFAVTPEYADGFVDRMLYVMWLGNTPYNMADVRTMMPEFRWEQILEARARR